MDSKIIIAIATGSLGLITALITSFWTLLQSKKIEKLKNELDFKKEKDSQIFKYLLTFETDIINQYVINLRDFVKITQQLKDQLRDSLNKRNDFFFEELSVSLNTIKQSIINQYSISAYYFNQTDNEKNAHEIKNLFLSIIDKVLSNDTFDSDLITNQIKEISKRQEELQSNVDSEIKRRLHEIEMKQ